VELQLSNARHINVLDEALELQVLVRFTFTVINHDDIRHLKSVAPVLPLVVGFTLLNGIVNGVCRPITLPNTEPSACEMLITKPVLICHHHTKLNWLCLPCRWLSMDSHPSSYRLGSMLFDVVD
jgi:hypothetical protein